MSPFNSMTMILLTITRRDKKFKRYSLIPLPIRAIGAGLYYM
jgi:hypothetical protein